MNSQDCPAPKDLFQPDPPPTPPLPKPVTLYLKRHQAPRRMPKKGEKPTEPKQNFHIPSFKNSKVWLTHTPRGEPLKRPFLITAPEFQQWMDRASADLESQLLSTFQTTLDEIQREPSKLLQILSCIPPDDSVRELREGSWTVEAVPPGEEGAKIVLERLP